MLRDRQRDLRTVSVVNYSLSVTKKLALLLASSFLFLACSPSDAPAPSPGADKTNLINELSSKASDAGGLVLSTNSATMLVAKNFKDYDVTSNSGLHFVFVGGQMFIDSSTPGAPSYTRATPEVLEQKGVTRERAARDSARIRMLLNLLGDYGSYKRDAVVEAVDLATFKVSIPASKMGADGVLAELGDEIEFVFTVKNDKIRAVSYASLASEPFYVTKFAKVSIKEPENVRG